MTQDTTDILRNAWATYYETLENLRQLQESTPRFRNEPDHPVVTVVKASEVMNHLPGDTRRVSPQERRQALAYRRESYLRMVDEIR